MHAIQKKSLPLFVKQTTTLALIAFCSLITGCATKKSSPLINKQNAVQFVSMQNGKYTLTKHALQGYWAMLNPVGKNYLVAKFNKGSSTTYTFRCKRGSFTETARKTVVLQSQPQHIDVIINGQKASEFTIQRYVPQESLTIVQTITSKYLNQPLRFNYLYSHTPTPYCAFK